MVITGTGGSGKSVLMRHLFLDCISSKKFIPVLIELRDLNPHNLSIDDLIKENLETFGFNLSVDYIKKAKADGHFCFFLDGYDEINLSIREKVIKQISKLSNQYKKCPIFISSRPDEVFNGLEDFSVFKIEPLNLQSASELINKLPFDRELKSKFIDALVKGLFEKHKSFLSNPLLLSIMLLTYNENAEIPSKLSIFYNQAYEALFQRHDANKGGYKRTRSTELDIQDFSRVFSLFSLLTYDKRIFKMPKTECLTHIERSRDHLGKKFKAEDYLTDLLSAVCLLIEEGLEISYSHRSFQEYFVALHISFASPSVQESLINRYWTNIRSDNVISLLAEINPELVERVLIVPRLEELFNEIGVKKKVGITHTTKYLKRYYKQFHLLDDSLAASRNHEAGNYVNVVHLSIQMCKNYVFPSQNYFKNFCIELKKTHKEKRTYPTNNLPQRSPLLMDISNGKGAFSKDYLQASFDAYQKLKLKHANPIINLNDLLDT